MQGITVFANSASLHIEKALMINVEINPICTCVHISNEDSNLVVTIRKIDGSSVGWIEKKNITTINSRFLRDYLPGWENMKWRNEPDKPPHYLTEYSGECGSYSIQMLIPMRDSGTSLEDVKDKFNALMWS